jgi:hypothetical protein
MTKLIRGIALVAVTVSLYFAMPYLRQKLFVTDETAAAALNQLESSEWGPRIIDCINLETAVSRVWSESNAVELTAHPNRGGPWDETHFVISGFVGWHVTWVMAIPLQTKPVVGYDMNNIGAGSMWLREVPTKVIKALGQCGVEYMGVWKGEAPSGF